LLAPRHGRRHRRLRPGGGGDAAGGRDAATVAPGDKWAAGRRARVPS
jgi:hypothetical protein